jgi:hypothetical protein
MTDLVAASWDQMDLLTLSVVVFGLVALVGCGLHGLVTWLKATAYAAQPDWTQEHEEQWS